MKRACLPLAGALLLLVATSLSAQQRAQGPRPPEVLPDSRVTFRLSAPNATSVALNGEWAAGQPAAMTKDDQGVWSVTVGPLKPELYAYTFIVDGVPALDGRVARFHRDGSRFENILIIPGPGGDLYEVNDVPHGTLSQVWYKSPTLKLTRRLYVYTPAGYEDSKTSYPVLYLLHGAGGDEDAWTSNGRAVQIMDNLIAKGQARPMIVVMTNGNANQAASPDQIVPPPQPPRPAAAPGTAGAPGAPAAPGAPGGGFNTTIETYSRFPNSIVNDVIPFIESRYRVIANRDNRAIAGLSMGGAATFFTGFTNLDKFSWIAGFSSAVVAWPGVLVRTEPPAGARLAGPGIGQGIDKDAVSKVFPNIDASVNSRLKMLYVSCGTSDGLITANRQFKEWLKSKDVRFVDVETDGYAHVWGFWRISLADVAQRLFK
jgi:enterochelin esterase-like enzyme